jgi:hypothetical protein
VQQRWWDPEWRNQKLAEKREEQEPSMSSREVHMLLENFVSSKKTEMLVPGSHTYGTRDFIQETAIERGLHW